MDKRFAGILVACIAALGIVFVFTNKKTDAPSTDSGGTQLSNHVFGDNQNKVNLTEYGDFQCSACYGYEPVLKEVRTKYQSQIAFQFRHFPLQEIHKNAMAASRAAEAAARQGKFWEMHDKLFETQDPTGNSGWTASATPLDEYFVGYAQELGLNVDKFKQDFASSAINSTINADRSEGLRLGVDSTPTFYLQGKKLDNPPRDIEGFSKLIDQAIKDSQKSSQ